MVATVTFASWPALLFLTFGPALRPTAAAQQLEIAAAVAFTEGPTVDQEGNVYFTDIVNQRIMKLSADGVLATYREHSNVANGAADRFAGTADCV